MCGTCVCRRAIVVAGSTISAACSEHERHERTSHALSIARSRHNFHVLTLAGAVPVLFTSGIDLDGVAVAQEHQLCRASCIRVMDRPSLNSFLVYLAMRVDIYCSS